MTEAQPQPNFARPLVAAGALFLDTEGRVLLGHPTYKTYWDIPGGYVEPGESPRAACVREIREELGLVVDVGPLLVVDWAPAQDEGDKILFIFDGGVLTAAQLDGVRFGDGELDQWRFIEPDELEQYVPSRLSRRLRTAIEAEDHRQAVYAEHGTEPDRTTAPDAQPASEGR